jgi:5-methylcytosine-specific restriction endonuclease McrA
MTRKSISDYPEDWPEIAKAVKDAAGWKCVRCGHPHDPAAGYCLTVHHLDLDPANCRWWNIPALCQRCHLSVQARVVMERPWMLEHTGWFKPYVAGYYAFTVLGEDLARDRVEARLDELLAAGQPWRANA